MQLGIWLELAPNTLQHAAAARSSTALCNLVYKEFVFNTTRLDYRQAQFVAVLHPSHLTATKLTIAGQLAHNVFIMKR